MPRPLQPIDDGLVYHVINRGNNRQEVFRKADDYPWSSYRAHCLGEV